MKYIKYKLILFLINFLTLHGSEQNAHNWFNSFKFHYQPGQEITVKNDTQNDIYLFGSILMQDEDCIKHIDNGIKLKSDKKITVNLCNIYSKEKIIRLSVYDYHAVKSTNVYIEVGAKYIVTQEYCDGIIHLKINKSE